YPLVRLAILPLKEHDAVAGELQAHRSPEEFEKPHPVGAGRLREPFKLDPTGLVLECHDVLHRHRPDQLNTMGGDPQLVAGLKSVQGRDDPRLQAGVQMAFRLVVEDHRGQFPNAEKVHEDEEQFLLAGTQLVDVVVAVWSSDSNLEFRVELPEAEK